MSKERRKNIWTKSITGSTLERERERATFYQKKGGMLFNQLDLLFYWRKEGVLSTLRDRSMNYKGYLIDKNGNKFFPDSYDSGWQTVNLTSEFKPYNNEEKYTPKYRKIGKIVEIFGQISPKATIEGSSDWHTIFTLPERI